MALANTLGSFTHGADPQELRRRADAQRRGMQSAPRPVLASRPGKTATRADFAAKVGLTAAASNDEILAALDAKLAAKRARADVAPGGEYPVAVDADVMSEGEYDALVTPKQAPLSAEDEATYRALFGPNA